MSLGCEKLLRELGPDGHDAHHDGADHGGHARQHLGERARQQAAGLAERRAEDQRHRLAQTRRDAARRAVDADQLHRAHGEARRRTLLQEAGVALAQPVVEQLVDVDQDLHEDGQHVAGHAKPNQGHIGERPGHRKVLHRQERLEAADVGHVDVEPRHGVVKQLDGPTDKRVPGLLQEIVAGGAQAAAARREQRGDAREVGPPQLAVHQALQHRQRQLHDPDAGVDEIRDQALVGIRDKRREHPVPDEARVLAQAAQHVAQRLGQALVLRQKGVHLERAVEKVAVDHEVAEHLEEPPQTGAVDDLQRLRVVLEPDARRDDRRQQRQQQVAVVPQRAAKTGRRSPPARWAGPQTGRKNGHKAAIDGGDEGAQPHGQREKKEESYCHHRSTHVGRHHCGDRTGGGRWRQQAGAGRDAHGGDRLRAVQRRGAGVLFHLPAVRHGLCDVCAAGVALPVLLPEAGHGVATHRPVCQPALHMAVVPVHAAGVPPGGARHGPLRHGLPDAAVAPHRHVPGGGLAGAVRSGPRAGQLDCLPADVQHRVVATHRQHLQRPALVLCLLLKPPGLLPQHHAVRTVTESTQLEYSVRFLWFLGTFLGFFFFDLIAVPRVEDSRQLRRQGADERMKETNKEYAGTICYIRLVRPHTHTHPSMTTTTTNAPSVAVAALGGIFAIVARLWPRVVSRWDADGGASYQEDWIQDQTGNVITTNSTELREIGANFGNARSPSVRANASDESNALPHTFVIEDLVFRIGLRRCRGEMACYRQSATDAAPAAWLYGARIFWIDTPDNPVGTARSLRSYAETLIELRSDGQFTVRCFSTAPITTTNSIDLLPIFPTVPFVVRSSSRGGGDDLLTKVQLIDRDGGQMLAIDAVKIRSAVLPAAHIAPQTCASRTSRPPSSLQRPRPSAARTLIIRLPGDDEEYALPSNAALLWLPAAALSVAANTQFVVSTLDNTLSGVVGVRLEHIGMILSALGVQTELLPLSGDGVHWAVRVGFQRRIRTMGTPVAYELRAGQSGFAGNWKLPEAERQLRADSAS
ncbi:hypothetical protein U1Q18_051627 [Sarracenia purpurea var. burkii]